MRNAGSNVNRVRCTQSSADGRLSESAAESRDSALPLKAARGRPVYGQGRAAGLPANPQATRRASRSRFSVLGGWFVADMATIEVTDIPAADPVPRNRLRRHLLSEDFFHVERHPEARFRIGSVTPQHGRLFQVVGALTIRDRTERVTFYARGWTVTADRVEGTARFAVDRHDYGVSYVGSTIKDDLVDDQFSLEIDILARRP